MKIIKNLAILCLFLTPLIAFSMNDNCNKRLLPEDTPPASPLAKKRFIDTDQDANSAQQYLSAQIEKKAQEEVYMIFLADMLTINRRARDNNEIIDNTVLQEIKATPIPYTIDIASNIITKHAEKLPGLNNLNECPPALLPRCTQANISKIIKTRLARNKHYLTETSYQELESRMCSPEYCNGMVQRVAQQFLEHNSKQA